MDTIAIKLDQMLDFPAIVLTLKKNAQFVGLFIILLAALIVIPLNNQPTRLSSQAASATCPYSITYYGRHYKSGKLVYSSASFYCTRYSSNQTIYAKTTPYVRSGLTKAEWNEYLYGYCECDVPLSDPAPTPPAPAGQSTTTSSPYQLNLNSGYTVKGTQVYPSATVTCQATSQPEQLTALSEKYWREYASEYCQVASTPEEPNPAPPSTPPTPPATNPPAPEQPPTISTGQPEFSVRLLGVEPASVLEQIKQSPIERVHPRILPPPYDWGSQEIPLFKELNQAGKKIAVTLHPSFSMPGDKQCNKTDQPSIQQFSTWAKQKVALHPYVDTWEIMNEADFDLTKSSGDAGGCYGSNPSGYANVFIAVAEAIKAQNPQTKVAISGLALDDCYIFNDNRNVKTGSSGKFNCDFLKQVLTELKRQNKLSLLEVVPIHAYNDFRSSWVKTNNTWLGTKADYVRELLDSFGLNNTEIWITEGTGASAPTDTWTTRNETNQATMAAIWAVEAAAYNHNNRKINVLSYFTTIDQASNAYKFGLFNEAGSAKLVWNKYLEIKNIIQNNSYRQTDYKSYGSYTLIKHRFGNCTIGYLDYYDRIGRKWGVPSAINDSELGSVGPAPVIKCAN